MNTIILASALACLPVVKDNESGKPWNKHDAKIIKQYTYRCGEIFPGAPCVSMVVKKEERVYWIICGPEKAVIEKLN